jgi:hypothetical protein
MIRERTLGLLLVCSILAAVSEYHIWFKNVKVYKNKGAMVLGAKPVVFNLLMRS